MNVDDLIYDLSFGVRLPEPTFCPPPIAHLIAKCFYDKPCKRPNFDEIKDDLKAAFNKLMNARNKNAEMYQNRTEIGTCYTELSQLSDDKMKSRYKTIERENQQEIKKYLYTKVQVVIEKEVHVSPLNYASVERAASFRSLNPKGNDGFDQNYIENIISDKGKLEKWITNDMESTTLVRQSSKLKRHHSLPMDRNGTQIKQLQLPKSFSTTRLL